ncbi:MAG: methionine--tRNA ligase subunit beta [Polyangiaceae bacterium]
MLIWPVMPKKSDAMRAQLGLPAVDPKVGLDVWPAQFSPRAAGEKLLAGSPLFPTIDKDREKELLDRLVPKPETGEAVTPPAAAPKAEKPAAATPAADESAPSPPITYDQFAAVDLRVGVVKTCEKVPKKDKLLKLTVDLGEAEPRNIIAGLALTFTPETLVGRRVVVVANLAPRDFGKGMVSHGMILATGPSEALSLATVPDGVPAGARLK